MKYSLPQLPYPYEALEPTIDRETMKLHHQGHHATYVEKLNKAIEEHPSLEKRDLVTLLTSLESLPAEVAEKIRNNGGGHFNHSLFWESLTPQKGTRPEGRFLEELESDFGSFENFKSTFSEVAHTHFGSGYAWLCVNKLNELITCSLPNQDTPLELGMRPIFLLDLWEHAYYLKYHYDRAKFIESVWDIVDWDTVQHRFLTITESPSIHKKAS